MKKTLFLFATAAIALASCSSDDTIAENMGLNAANEISLRAFVQSATRAADINQTWLQGEGHGFWVTAKYKATPEAAEAAYFNKVNYTYDSGSSTYTSVDKYYWPSTGTLNFYAWAPEATTTTGPLQITSDPTTFVVTPDATANTNTQTDFVYATATDQTKAANGSGVSLTFHHAESKICLKAQNTSPTLDITINGAISLNNVSGVGTFTYTGVAEGKLKYADWGSRGAATALYSQTAGTTAFPSTTAAASISNELILIPQAITPATAYSGVAGTSIATGSYIKIPVIIKNKGSEIVIYQGDAIWPVPAIQWNPGYKYTYTVDLAGGGFYATNQDADTDLDPVLGGSEIIFSGVGVTVDEWSDAPNTTIGNMTFAKNGTYSENIATTAGVYYITVTGLTATNTVSVTGTVNCISPSVLPTTVGASGSVTITCPVDAGTSATSVITLIEKDGELNEVSRTTINLVQAAN